MPVMTLPAAARQGDVRPLELLAVGELDWRALPPRTFRAVGEIDEPRLRRRHRVTAGRQRLEGKPAIVVRDGRPSAPQFLSRERHARAADRCSGPFERHGARDRAGADRHAGRGIARCGAPAPRALCGGLSGPPTPCAGAPLTCDARHPTDGKSRDEES
jgi:hypothetical protein